MPASLPTCCLCYFLIREGSDCFNSQLVGRRKTQRACLCPGPVIQRVPMFHSSSPMKGKDSNARCFPITVTAAYLVITDGNRGMKEVPNFSKTFKSLCIQSYPLSITLDDGFINKESDFFYLCHFQVLYIKKARPVQVNPSQGQG